MLGWFGSGTESWFGSGTESWFGSGTECWFGSGTESWFGSGTETKVTVPWNVWCMMVLLCLCLGGATRS